MEFLFDADISGESNPFREIIKHCKSNKDKYQIISLKTGNKNGKIKK